MQRIVQKRRDSSAATVLKTSDVRSVYALHLVRLCCFGKIMEWG